MCVFRGLCAMISRVFVQNGILPLALALNVSVECFRSVLTRCPPRVLSTPDSFGRLMLFNVLSAFSVDSAHRIPLRTKFSKEVVPFIEQTPTDIFSFADEVCECHLFLSL
jgi:hypothetical protein